MACKAKRVAGIERAARSLARLLDMSGEQAKRFDPVIAREIGCTESRARNLRQRRARIVHGWEAKRITALGNARRMRGDDADAAGSDDIGALKKQIAALIRRIDRLENSPRS